MEDRRTNRTSKLGLCCRGFVVPLRWDFVDGFVRLLHSAGVVRGNVSAHIPCALPEGGGLVFLFQCLLVILIVCLVFLFNACCQFSIQIVARTR